MSISHPAHSPRSSQSPSKASAQNKRANSETAAPQQPPAAALPAALLGLPGLTAPPASDDGDEGIEDYGGYDTAEDQERTAAQMDRSAQQLLSGILTSGRNAALLPDYLAPGDEAATSAFKKELGEVVARYRLPSYGGYGEVQAVVARVPSAILTVPDWHPRDDWQRNDEDMRSLIASMDAWGQREPMYVTAVLSDDPRRNQGRYLDIINGARRLQAGRLSTKHYPYHDVLFVTYPDGLPIAPFHQVCLHILLHSNGLRKDPSPSQVTTAVAQLMVLWDQDALTHMSQQQFPTIRELAEIFGFSSATMGRALQVLDEHKSVIYAVASRRIPTQALLMLQRLVSSRDERAAIVDRVLQLNDERAMLQRAPMTATEIIEMVQATLLPPTSTSPTYRITDTLRSERILRQPRGQRDALELLYALFTDGFTLFDHLRVAGAPIDTRFIELVEAFSTEGFTDVLSNLMNKSAPEQPSIPDKPLQIEAPTSSTSESLADDDR